MKKYLLSFTWVFSVFCGYAQSTSNPTNIKIGVEFGINGLTSNPTSSLEFRKSHLPTYSSNSLQTTCEQGYINTLADFSFWNHKLWISTGISYSQINSQISGPNNSEFFYIQYEQPSAIQMLRVKNITQTNHYVGIPLDVRVMISPYGRVKMYVKTGIQLYGRVNSKQSVEFVNSEMQKYEEVILNSFNTSNNLMSFIYPGFGFVIGNHEGIHCRLELNIPINLTPNSYGINQPVAGGGGSALFLIPLNL